MRKRHFKRKASLVVPQDELSGDAFESRIQQQLNTLEKKLDILISQSSKKPFSESYSKKSFRPFNSSHRQDKGRPSNSSGEKTYTRIICAACKKECEVPFKPSGGRPAYCKECFLKHREGASFKNKYDDKPGFIQTLHFDKKHGGENRKPKKKKSTFGQKKERILNI